MTKTPLISICIPTYGHDVDLKAALATLVALPSFTESDDVEVVISDNCSPDKTGEVCAQFVRDWPGRIRYFRNETNIRDANFGMSLSRGNGLFLKLTNDTIIFSETGLRRMIEIVRKYKDEKPVLFFSNQEKTPAQRTCNTITDFVDETSMFSTWIGSFGIWKSDMDTFEDFARMRELYLTQVDVLCRLILAKRRAEVFNYVFCVTLPRPDKGGYSVPLIFGDYYFRILKPYVDSGELTPAAYRLELKRILRHQILPFALTFSNAFDNEGYFKYIFKNYWTNPVYWCAMPFVVVASGLKKLKGALARFNDEGSPALPMLFHRLTFRRRNGRNAAYPLNMFRHGCVAVGLRTTGGLRVYGSQAAFARLLIGDDVAVSPGVRFFLSGECDPNDAAPAPERQPVSKGPIVIRDNVHIGRDATICSGVIVGEGAVILPDSVVATDIPPRAIVRGNPARIEGYRN